MTTPVRVVGFVLGLLVVFLAARGVGAVAAPDPAPPAPMGHDGMAEPDHDGETEEPAEHGDHEEPEPTDPASDGPGGLAVSDQGYTLRIVSTPRPGIDRPLRFVIDGPGGRPVTAYEEVHDQPLHLVKIRRDGADYQHVHPRLAADGTWTARMTLSPGTSRVFADFTPTDGPALVLGTDVQLDGDYAPSPPPDLTRTARVDGYRVTLDGDLAGGESSPLTATITRGRQPVTDLQPYLGAFGHLVALREGDLAYLHVHPEQADAGPEIPFVAEVPSDGRYRLFLEFRHRGVVRTVGFTLAAGEVPAASHGEGEDHDH
ncbi:MAG: hypothetical protein ACRDO4_17910 [Nocardioides sp.]